ncbi:MAG: glycoside hydrolase family 15 protein [Chthoniobacterales bacterium]
MAKIEDYAFLSDTQTCALVSREGSVDWLCFPRFDSGACFAALLGDKDNGRWLFAPNEKMTAIRRRYRGDSLILETELETASGVVRLIDFMPPRGNAPDIVRIVEGVKGSVEIRMELTIRFDYGHIVPWVRKVDGALQAIAGPDALILRAPIATHGENLHTVARFNVAKGDRIPFVLTWFASHEKPPRAIHPEHALAETEAYWKEWAAKCQLKGPWRDAIIRSLLTLKGLTYAPTGGIVAAGTTSLPEKIGGVRNWDYRYCWLRDANFTLMGLMGAGYLEEARAWREWLLRAVAGSPSQMQIMYGVCGERRLVEFEVTWLKGYENSKPVRIGNAAFEQFQLDIYGELLGSMCYANEAGIKSSDADWGLLCVLMNSLESRWEKPDHGIWEVRGEPQHFTHSKMMAWAAFDRAVKMIELRNCDEGGNLARWRKIRDTIHEQVCAQGYNARKKAFTQFYGSEAMDASLLMMPMVGFLPATDERVRNTIEAIERELMHEGFILRYRPQQNNIDGLPGSEGIFLLCSFWFARCLYFIGRQEEACEFFERLLALRNDVGLLSEEYDPIAKRMLGNFPQAFSHVALVNTARVLTGELTFSRSVSGRDA